MTVDKNASMPIYLQLRKSLEKSIRDGVFKDNKFPSENALSAKYSINRLTARRAILELEDAGLIYTVPGKGRFVRTSSAFQGQPSVKSGNSRSTVLSGFTEVDISNSIFQGLLTELTRLLHEQNSEIRFMTRAQLKKLNTGSGNVDSIIVAPMEADIPMLQNILTMDLPLVAVNRAFPGIGIPYVAIDQYSGTFNIVKNMINSGHKDIACITGNLSLNKYMQERMSAFSDAFKVSNLQVKPEYILNIDSPEEDFTLELNRFFKKNKNVTAVFLTGEVYQETTLKYFVDNAINIPDDMSIAAIDEMFHADGLPRITCLRQPMEEMAARAVSILNEISSGAKAANASRGEMLQPVLCDNGTIKNIK